MYVYVYVYINVYNYAYIFIYLYTCIYTSTASVHFAWSNFISFVLCVHSAYICKLKYVLWVNTYFEHINNLNMITDDFEFNIANWKLKSCN
jgi:hypothetical protein